MNAYGVFDTARFDLVSRLTMDVENKSFERKDFRIDGNLYYYKQYDSNRVYNETKINFSKNIPKSFPTKTNLLKMVFGLFFS